MLISKNIVNQESYIKKHQTLQKIIDPLPQKFKGLQKRGFFWYWCFHPHQLRESVSPVCNIFTGICVHFLFNKYYKNQNFSCLIFF